MTDKQIIIDGVDVSGCIHYKATGRYNTCGYCCEQNPNCYYKNWKHKEQVYEKLKEKYKNLCKACPKNVKCSECNVKDTLEMLEGRYKW